MLIVALSVVFFPLTGAEASTENPFPGVAYGAEIPGLSKVITCTDTPQIPDDCVRQGGGQVICPTDSANDITPTLRQDGSWASLKSWCRNSWSPPTSAADDEDFRNRQQLAIAAATLESQAYSAANPGEQKCITWGPIVHANGISTSSGGVCANVVGTKPDGTTVAVPPSRVGDSSSGQTTGQVPSIDSSTAPSGSTGGGNSRLPGNSGAQTLIPYVDLTQYGFGKPFTRVVKGNLTASQCPSGFDAATNQINTGFSEYPATECWPSNAWAAYSIGGDVWTRFKSTNGSINAEAEASRRIQVNAVRALALQQAQQFANQTIGVKRCASWNAFGESGQECAYIPIQNNSMGGIVISASDSSTTQIKSGSEVVVAKLSSAPGQSQSDWEKSDSYTAFVCPGGSGKSLSLDLNGTTSKTDDIWTLSCIQVLDSSDKSETATVVLTRPNESNTVVNAQESFTVDSRLLETQTAITADAIQFKGSISQVRDIIKVLQISDSESKALNNSLSKLVGIKAVQRISKVNLPNSVELQETARSLTPSVCRVSGLVIQAKKTGVCQITFSVEGTSGNTLETLKKITFKN
jgi:hypothetical protein